MEEKNLNVIDLRIIFQKIWANRKLFAIVLPFVFILSCLYIICIPRTYTSDTRMAPEMENSMSSGTLGSIASTFGIDLGSMQTTDAITPLLYPDLMDDNKFVASLFNIEVESIDGEIKTDYYNYLKTHQKYPWWNGIKRWFRSLISPKAIDHPAKNGFNPYQLSKKDNDIMSLIREQVVINVNKKDGVITIGVEAQDPLICKTIADSVRTRLQEFITEYRTSKSRNDLEYYKKLTAEAKMAYEKARQLYGNYSDANTDVILESYRAKREDLENDMQLKFNTYSTMNTQLQASKAKVQERTPAFTVIKGASVPIRPSGPKRMLFVAGMLLLAFVVICIYSIKDILFNE